MRKKQQRSAEQANRVAKTATICRVSPRQVRRVINGECENDYVMEIYMSLVEGENKLLEEVKKIVPFEKVA